MAQTLRFFWDNLLDSATLTASSENSQEDGSVDNLLNTLRSKYWETAGVTPGTANLVIDLGSAQAVKAVILSDYPDWAVAPGTLDFEMHTSDSWGSPDFTENLTDDFAASPDTYRDRNVICKCITETTKRYCRLNVVNSGGDWRLGRMFIGPYFEPTQQIRSEIDDSFSEFSVLDSSPSGAYFSDEVDEGRVRSFSFKTTSYTQKKLFDKMFNTVKKSKPLFISFDYTNYPNSETMYGRFQSYKISRVYNLYTIEFTFSEDVE